jgi:chromosome segregation ATPase
MNKQSGISAVAVVAGVAVLAVAGVGFVAWRNYDEVYNLRIELNSTKLGLEKARGEAKKATSDFAAASKELTQLKVTSERAVAERDAVRKTMEDEQATSVQLRGELALAKEQLSYLTARTSKDVVRGMPTRLR